MGLSLPELVNNTCERRFTESGCAPRLLAAGSTVAGVNADSLYSRLIDRDVDSEADLPQQVRKDLPANGLRQVGAMAMQSSGDQIMNASTVLPWLFATLGVPGSLVGFLVPIRESGSMLPQAMITPIVLRVKHRRWVFVAGSVIQALSVGAIALVAALASGMVAGVLILLALAVFSFGRCLGSIASKDVQGSTIPKGERGQINGISTTASGFIAITLGLLIRVFGGPDASVGVIIGLLLGAAALWSGVALVFSRITDPPADVTETDKGADRSGSDDSKRERNSWVRDSWELLRDDSMFRHFVFARSLLLVSSLSPAFIVTLSIELGASALVGLGGFIVASGIAKLIGGRIFGKFADRSSSRLMSIGAAIASAIIIGLVIITWLPAFDDTGWLVNVMFVGAYLAITLMHTGVRIGRKTYVVDMAEGDLRTKYVAVSNSAMGVILLVVGAISSAFAAIHINWALLFLAGLGLLGVYVSAKLPDVSKK